MRLRHGIVRCKTCGGPTEFVSFARSAGKGRTPRLYVTCAMPTEECQGRQPIGCAENWRMLLPLWRTDATYLALRHSGKRYERVHLHWRQRYRVASDDHNLRPKRKGLACQQLRANAALLLEWLQICWREGAQGEFVQVRLAGVHVSGRFKPGGRRGGRGGDVIAEDRRPVRRPDARGVEQVLDRKRNARLRGFDLRYEDVRRQPGM